MSLPEIPQEKIRLLQDLFECISEVELPGQECDFGREFGNQTPEERERAIRLADLLIARGWKHGTS